VEGASGSFGEKWDNHVAERNRCGRKEWRAYFLVEWGKEE